MTRAHTAAAPALALLLSAAPAAAEVDLEAAFQGFYEVGLAEEGIPVRDLVLARPDATFTLREGAFLPAQPLEGVVTGGVFLGRGEVVFRPSQAPDRRLLAQRQQEWLKRDGGEEYRAEFQRLVMRFTDDTLREIQGAGGEPVPHEGGEAEAAWRARNGLWSTMDNLGPVSFVNFNLEMDFLEWLLNGGDDRTFFVAEMDADGWVTYVHSAFNTHEIFFGNHRSLGVQEEVHPFTLTSVKEDFGPDGAYVADAGKDDKLTLDTSHYRVNVTIPDLTRVEMDALVEFTPRRTIRAARFDLVNNVRLEGYARWTDRGRPVDVTAVTDGDGNPLRYIHKRHQILVEFPEPLPAGEEASLAVAATEKTIIQLTPESYWLLNTYPWFPQIGFAGGRNTHEWTVCLKSPLVGVVSGRRVRQWEQDGYGCSGWIMDDEVQFPSLIFGRFHEEEDVYRSELTGTEVKLRVFVIPVASLDGVNYAGLKKAQPVLNEAKEILKFMEDLFGPYPFDYMNIAQMSPGLGFGQAPPGLIQLTGEAFMSAATLAALGARGDFFHEFFSHEIAHQWWAHAVWGTSFRDAWLSESFAEYSAGLYVQQYLGLDRFQGKMKEWRQNAQRSEGAAPLAALSTISGDLTGQSYTDLIYNKGPYVVHMLRMQMGHDKWVEGMQSFFGKHRMVNLTTEALMAELEQAAGYKLDFFLDQWWKGTGIPSFDFQWEASPTEDGRYLFTGTLRQEGRPFKVLMPYFFHFGGKEVSIQNRPVLEAEDVYRAFLPKKPQKVTLDDFNTLLADIRQK